jgi:pyruvate kinase
MSQMLASMVTASRPTRAEATDVANAIYDGTDALMLCEETAVGAHPIEAVKVMDSIARATEPDLPRADWLVSRTDAAHQDIADAVAHGAVGAAYRLGLSALVVPTATGRTARLVSAHRPSVPVLAVTPEMKTVRRLGILSGVTATIGSGIRDTGGLLYQSARLARTCGVARSGDLIGVTAGLHGHGLGTNLFGVHRVP